MHPDIRMLFHTKKHELSDPEKLWRKLKCIRLSEKSQSEKAPYCDSNAMTSGKGKTMEIVK